MEYLGCKEGPHVDEQIEIPDFHTDTDTVQPIRGTATGGVRPYPLAHAQILTSCFSIAPCISARRSS